MKSTRRTSTGRAARRDRRRERESCCPFVAQINRAKNVWVLSVFGGMVTPTTAFGKQRRAAPEGRQ
eukprot:10684663-Lingulodinium_polyedra.AAC.1